MKTLVTILGSLLLGASSAVHAAGDLCSRPRGNRCEFYRQCAEATYKCGDSGYPIAYGEKYCHRFSGLKGDDLSKEGFAWRDATLTCLQQDIANLFVTSNKVKTCGDLKDFAFASHVGCYTQPFASVCNLPLGDWVTITGVVDLKEYGDRESRAQVIQVIKACGPAVKDRVAELLKRLGLLANADREEIHAVLAGRVQVRPMSDQEYTAILNELAELQDKLEFIEGGVEI